MAPEVEVLMPASLDEALAAKARHGANAAFVAGGTDIVLQTRAGKRTARTLIRLPPRTGPAAREEQGVVLLSPFATMSELLGDPAVSRLPVLVKALSQIGSPQVRNAATLGGNLGNASPAGDNAPALLVYEAVLTLRSLRGDRAVPLEDFFVGPGRTVLSDDEVIAEVRVPAPRQPEFG
jgi:CO/xanthine dehydrogenase FAD-binding subunit